MIDTLRAVVIEPAPDQQGLQHLCLDKGYDYSFVEEMAFDFGYMPHIRTRGEEKKDKQGAKSPGDG